MKQNVRVFVRQAVWKCFGTSALLLISTACGVADTGGEESTPTVAASMGPSSQRAALDEGGTCAPTGAHARHDTLAIGCEGCHGCGGGTFGFPSDLVLPRGTTTAGGQILHDPVTGAVTCSVGCHNPLGAPASSIGWNDVGPLACTRCHVDAAVASARSGHTNLIADPIAGRAACQSCHVMTAHLGGTARINAGDGTVIDVPAGAAPAALNAACLACHDGNGAPIDGSTPPLLVGYSSPTGDFHGSRAGTGYGGTLKAPYTRGQAALPCRTCHSPHSSTNDFMFASTVNSSVIPASSINRAGVGAQTLCESCHQGTRHAGCQAAGCHNGVDPAPPGVACFYCHGHEGLMNFVFPAMDEHGVGSNGCAHCHDPAAPQPEYTAPTILASPGISAVGVTHNSANITWQTNEPSTSYVEYGLGSATLVAGNNIMTSSHSVLLTGLQAATTYSFRARTSDRMRNLTVSALATFTTSVAGAPAAPVLVDQTDVSDWGTTMVVALRWSAVTAPDGHAVQYQMVLDNAADFATPVITTGWISVRNYNATVPTNMAGVRYYWRVQARDAVHNPLQSGWSAVDGFTVWQIDPESYE